MAVRATAESAAKSEIFTAQSPKTKAAGSPGGLRYLTDPLNAD